MQKVKFRAAERKVVISRPGERYRRGSPVPQPMTVPHFFAALCLLAGFLSAVDAKTVRAFILAGQSNMEGKAKNSLLDFQATDDKTKEHYAHLRDDDGWITRDDVFIKFLGRKGPLTVGYGSPGRTGLELEFGHAMGEHFDDPVVLIKAAWGGHSLSHNFRPPSAGDPGDGKPFGESYRNMMKEFNTVAEDYKKLFPDLRGADFELAGFVWFQGFNDQFGDSPGQYEDNMKHFINDIRRDLEKPELPFVIACLGTNGSKPPGGNSKVVQDAQLAMNKVAEFKGNVKAFRTDELIDKEAEKLFPTWKENTAQWEKTGSDRPYHYYGSGIWYGRIGKTAGEAMLELLPDDDAKEGARRPTSRAPHVFRSADGSKSFKAVLIDYDPTTEIVRVRMPNLRISKFKIDVLSAEDQDYVRKAE